MTPRATQTLVALLFLAGLVACSGPERAAGPALLSGDGVVAHVVLFDLAEGADVDALVADCDRWLAPIPSVIAYDVGRPLDIGRAGVGLDFDMAAPGGRHPARDGVAHAGGVVAGSRRIH